MLFSLQWYIKIVFTKKHIFVSTLLQETKNSEAYLILCYLEKNTASWRMRCIEEGGIRRQWEEIPTKEPGTEAGHHPGGTILLEEMVEDLLQ